MIHKGDIMIQKIEQIIKYITQIETKIALHGICSKKHTLIEQNRVRMFNEIKLVAENNRKRID